MTTAKLVAVCAPLALAACVFAQSGNFAEPQQPVDPSPFLAPPAAGEPSAWAQQGMTDFTVPAKTAAALLRNPASFVQNLQETQNLQQGSMNFQQSPQNFGEMNFQQTPQSSQGPMNFQQTPQNLQQSAMNFQQTPQNLQGPMNFQQTPQNLQGSMNLQTPQNFQQSSQNFDQEAANIEELHLALQPPSP